MTIGFKVVSVAIFLQNTKALVNLLFHIEIETAVKFIVARSN